MQAYKCTVNAVFVFLITVLFSFRTAAALKRENDSQTNGSYCCELFLNRCSRSDVWAEILLRTCHISLSLYNKRNFSHCSSSSLQFFSVFYQLLCVFNLCSIYTLSNSSLPQWEKLQQFASVLSARILSRVPRSKGGSSFSPRFLSLMLGVRREG